MKRGYVLMIQLGFAFGFFALVFSLIIGITVLSALRAGATAPPKSKEELQIQRDLVNVLHESAQVMKDIRDIPRKKVSK